MFQALSSALQSTLAPDVPPIVDFKEQWNSFLRFYTSKKPLHHKSQPVEGTNLIFHLNRMLKILVREQQDIEENALGPCLEYLIHHQVLDILSSICQADSPPGIRPYILKVFVFMLTKIKQEILPYATVYYPMRRVIMLSSVTKASPTESQELSLLTCLLSKVKSNPELLSLFAQDPRNAKESSLASSRRSSEVSSIMDLSGIEELNKSSQSLLEDFESSHLIVAALLNLIESADYLISIKAMDALLVTVSIPDTIAATNAVHGTRLIPVISSRLLSLYDTLPNDLEVAMIEELKVNWMEAHHLFVNKSERETLPDFPGKSELISLFSWIDFCNDLANKGHEIIIEAVIEAVRESLLDGRLQRDLMLKPEKHVQTVALVTQTWSHMSSEGLAGEFSNWLLGNDVSLAEMRDMSSHPLKELLIKLCMSEQQDIALETLSLFDVILDRPCDKILDNLILRNIVSREYFNNSLAESSISSWSDEEERQEKQKRQFDLEELTKRSSRSRKSPSPFSVYGSRTMAPRNIARVINSWLYLVPDCLRGSDSAKDSGYEQYVKNAQTQVSQTFKRCEGFSWPLEAVQMSQRSNSTDSDFVASDSSDSRIETDENSKHFFEGKFLSMLFDMIENILERNYDCNLQVTSILSKLAQVPHPHLHEYLLNPTIPLNPGTRTLFKSMQTVLERIKESTKDIDQLQRKIYLCKKTLVGNGKDRDALNLTQKETQIIDGLIILEEFSKEIAAITLVKYHLAS